MDPKFPLSAKAEASLLGEASFRPVTKKMVFREERDRFEVCQPIVREKSEWMGLRKKTIFAHRTGDDRWDIRIV